MDCSVPHGSALGPLEFISYTDEVSEIFSRHAVNYHLFADDKQLSESDKVSDTSAIICRVSACVTDIATWCASRRLQLNAAKTEIAWFDSRANLNKISGSDLCLPVGSNVIKPRELSCSRFGVYLDSY